eukprot:TRINITY_DN48735_c0_g1_i1.p1 TRINITY_DN48735_c0_g1~~TRINITY_DN48735_c0_g1_i1.p1  ORF type:complete len:930 (+),score=164.06 TRINITY_DN48735_c0_g1_i1:99-2888(+)
MMAFGGACVLDQPQSYDDLNRLSAADLRRLLCRVGVSDRGCVEKRDFVALAARCLGLQPAPPSLPPPTVPVTVMVPPPDGMGGIFTGGVTGLHFGGVGLPGGVGLSLPGGMGVGLSGGMGVGLPGGLGLLNGAGIVGSTSLASNLGVVTGSMGCGSVMGGCGGSMGSCCGSMGACPGTLGTDALSMPLIGSGGSMGACGGSMGACGVSVVADAAAGTIGVDGGGRCLGGGGSMGSCGGGSMSSGGGGLEAFLAVAAAAAATSNASSSAAAPTLPASMGTPAADAREPLIAPHLQAQPSSPRALSIAKTLGLPSLKSDWSYMHDDGQSGGSRSCGKDSGTSRSSSYGSRHKHKPHDWATDLVKLSADDAAGLAMGTGGKTKEKIARASEAEIELNQRELQLKISGTTLQRRRARKYAELITKQRIGPHFATEDFDDCDLTVLSVPPEVVGYVQGHGGSVLRNIEEEWGTLMIFVDVDLSRAQRLAIFGSVRGRRGSELKVMSAVETKMPGYFSTVLSEIVNRDRRKDPTGTWGTDYMSFRDEGEISYALGKQGGTRRKLERSSGAVVQYVGMVVICSGTKVERIRAKEYMKWLFQQLEGPVYVDGWEGRDDCTVVDIPSDCIGYITGNRRATLGALEEEWGTLMFFMSESERAARSGRRGGTEKLAIFGPERPRRGSELKVMSGIETKSPGTFTRGVREKTSNKKGFDTDRFVFRDEEVSYALGKDGATRKKLELASGAILQYVGNVAYVAGSRQERRRCREFVQWLLQQRRGSVTIGEVSRRNDVTEVHIPLSCKGWVTGNRGSELRRMEQASGTYMFMALDSKGEERLLIFGVNPGSKNSDGGRVHAERMVNDMIQEKLRDDNVRRARARSESRRRDRSDSRRPSPVSRRRDRVGSSPPPRRRSRSGGRRASPVVSRMRSSGNWDRET